MSLLTHLRSAYRRWRKGPVLRAGSATDARSSTERYLLYVVLPLWLVPGLLDWAWHRRTRIEDTSGTRESLVHALMMAEVGVPVSLGLLLEITPLVLAIMMANVALHTATAFWDVKVAVTSRREVRLNEQHMHSLLEVLPFMATSFMICLHWDALRALRHPRSADWTLRLKRPRLPGWYLSAVGVGILGGLVLPYGEELSRCLRAGRQRRAQARPSPQAKSTALGIGSRVSSADQRCPRSADR